MVIDDRRERHYRERSRFTCGIPEGKKYRPYRGRHFFCNITPNLRSDALLDIFYPLLFVSYITAGNR